ncbi:hypothetical protein I317_03659 [Kwoniella heveanensis CBS 569]|nr:hypothetical protein I317_03659 [Kwoniella heveanensis CBS 569]
MQSSPLPSTPAASRYPASLSHATSCANTTVPGPARPSTRGYPAPSIDSSIGSPPSASSLPLHEYSSLADLLQQAGYKETRVYTPEAEKIRSRIKKTLDDENEDEINALYGTYGFDRNSGIGGVGDREGLGHGEIRHHITEPGLPMKSSSSILRSLALQDAASSLPKTDTPDQSWWTAWGRTPKSDHTSPDAKSNASYEASTEVGLGLAKGGEGVRKVRSTWDVERSRPRRAGTDSPPQEERPPRPRVPSSPADVITTTSATGYTYTHTPTKQPTRRVEKDIFSSPPPPTAVDEDAYGYCPLPEDYEAQCTEDEAMYAMGVNDYTDIYSLGSNSNTASAAGSFRDTASTASISSERSRTRSETEERAVREIQEFQDEMAMIDEVNQVGQRILRDAVQYDDSLEFDSPDSQTTPLPDIGARDSFRMPSIPVPPVPRGTAPAQNSYLKDEEQAPDTPKPVGRAEQQKKPLKYGDRATRLRIAHSTPALRQTAASSTPPLPEGWLGSIRSALIGRSEPATTSTSPQPLPFTSQPRGPIRISPITPAMPTLVTTSPVICDSISTEAEDLPPVPSPRVLVTSAESSSSTGISTFALKLRPSLAKLREAVLGSAPSTDRSNEDSISPMLSPRLDWGEQGEQFAGWSPAKSKKGKQVLRDSNEGGIDVLFGPQAVAAAAVDDKDIDYSKSFFYKPTTPPKCAKSHNSAADCASNPTCTVTPSTPPSERPGMKKRQSIKSLKAALLLPVAPASAAQPPVPAIPAHLSHLATPRKMKDPLRPPILAIQSPGAWQPRELVLEGEEWDAREGSVGDWGRGRGKGRGSKGSGVRRRKSKKVVRD